MNKSKSIRLVVKTLNLIMGVMLLLFVVVGVFADKSASPEVQYSTAFNTAPLRYSALLLIPLSYLIMIMAKNNQTRIKTAYWGIVGGLLMLMGLVIDSHSEMIMMAAFPLLVFSVNIKYGHIKYEPDIKKESVATKITVKDEHPIQETVAPVIIPAFVENKVQDAPIAIPVSTTPQKHISVCVRCKEEISFNTFTEEFTCPKCGIRNVSAATWQKIQNPLSSLGIGYWVQLIIFVIILGWIVDFMVAVGI